MKATHFLLTILSLTSMQALACETNERTTPECRELIKRLEDFKQKTKDVFLYSDEFRRKADQFSSENSKVIQDVLNQANKDKEFAVQQLHNFGRLSLSEKPSIFKKVGELVDDAVKKVNVHAEFIEKELGRIILGKEFQPKSPFGFPREAVVKVEKMTMPEIIYFLYSDMDDTSRLVQYSDETKKIAAEYIKQVDADALATRQSMARADQLRKVINKAPQGAALTVKQLATGAARAAR